MAFDPNSHSPTEAVTLNPHLYQSSNLEEICFMNCRFVDQALVRAWLCSSAMVFAACLCLSVATAQRPARKEKAHKLPAKTAFETRERQERRVRKFANQTAVPETGKRATQGPRRAVGSDQRQPRAPFGWEADDVMSHASFERYDKPREAARFFRSKRLPVGEDGKFTMPDLPLERYFAAAAQMREMPLYSTANNAYLTGEKNRSISLNRKALEPEQSTWQPLGPGNIGGRTRALVIHPQDPNIMYAAGVSGGVWKTTNAGQAWTPIGDQLALLTVSSLLLDPTNPNTLYVGTGEGFSAFDEDTVGDLRGAGIFKSTDAGATFTRLASTTTGSDFYFVNDLVASPSNNQRLYAATRSGVWRTTDGGAMWTRVLNPLNEDGDPVTGGCLDLAIRTDKMDADVLFAACGTFEQGQIYRTTNGAGSEAWQQVLSEPLMGRTALAIAPSNQDTVYAVATVLDPSNRSPYQFALHAVFRSTTGGAQGSWTPMVRNTNANKLNTALLSYSIFAAATDCGFDLADDFTSQAWFDLTIAVDPVDPQRVWVGAIDLFRSDDGGANWGQATHVYLDRRAPQYIHTDQHTLVFHPQYNGTTNQILYVGNDGGLWLTDNARATVATGRRASCTSDTTAVNWRTLNNGYGVTQFYHGTVYPDGKTYFGGTQDNGTLRGTDNGGVNNWVEINGGDGGYVAVDRNNTNTLYAEFTGLTIQKSTDNGASFSSARLGLNDNGLFIAPYRMDPSDPNRLFAGGAFIWRSTNAASNWVRASALTAGVGDVSSIAIAPTDSNFVLCGMSDGFILRSQSALTTNATTNWASTTPRRGFVSSVTFDPKDKNIAYATYSTFGISYVWRSADAGVSWTPITGSGTGALPDVPAHSLVVDPTNSARLYLGTDTGVFVSNDTGNTWAVENTGFANVITETLQLNVVNGEAWLYAFTHGRGAWRVKLAGTACAYDISPATLNVAETGGMGTINVNAVPGSCAWTSASNAAWLRVTGSGNGAGQATYTADANPSVLPRTGTITVAGRSLAIHQPGLTDAQSPVVAITDPSGTNLNDTTGTVTLRGTATDNGLIAAMTWTTDRGNTGTATYSATAGIWTATTIPLVSGPNVVTVTARDSAGNLGRATVRVTSRPSLLVTTFAGIGTLGSNGDGGPASAAQLGSPTNIAFDAQGNLLVADTFNDRIRRIAPDGRITTVAGGAGNGFSGDGGPATQARLNCPTGIAVDAQGNLYIADSENNRIRRVAAADGIITTIAGTGATGFGGDGGPAAQAQIDLPTQVALTGNNLLYVADTDNSRIRRINLADGMITTYAGNGTATFAGDGGAATAASLNRPKGLTFDAQGNLFIADTFNNRVRRVAASDNNITTVAGTGTRGFTGDGDLATNARLGQPEGVWVDAQNNLLIADTFNDRIRRVSVADQRITTIAGIGITGYGGDGSAASAARFFCPIGIVTDAAGRLFIADRDNNRIRLVQPVPTGDTAPPTLAVTQPTSEQSFTATASPLRLAGTAADNGTVLSIQWSNDRGANGTAAGTTAWTVAAIPLFIGMNNITLTAFDLAGNTTTTILSVTFNPSQLISTLAGNGVIGNDGDGGAGALAQLWAPRAVAVDGAGNVYVADNNHRVRRISASGQITAFAGNGIVGNAGDGGRALDANFNQPRGLAVDSAGNVYIADTLNHRIRKVTAADGRIATLAGTGVEGNRGDDGPAAQAELSFPTGVALDAQGNVYIADTGNNRVRRINVTNNTIMTLAGNGEIGFSGDNGPAAQAQLFAPVGIAVDSAGNVYFIDQGNQRLRRVSASDQRIATVLGTGTAGFNGDERLPLTTQLNEPRQIAINGAGEIFIADQGNHRVRRFQPATGLVTTVAGIGTFGFSGDSSAPTTAALSIPQGVAVDAQGNLFIADTGNNRVRKVQAAATVRVLTTVSAASYQPFAASEAIVAAFGTNLATSAVAGTTTPLPTTLAGISVRVRDSLGGERLAPLFFVSPNQINYLVPPGTADGVATVTINAADGSLITGTLNVAAVAPGLFTANADGQGVPAALTLRIKADGALLYEMLSRFDQATNRHVATPIDLGPESDQVFLILFGTGARGRSALAAVTARLGGTAAEVLFAGPQGLVGLDQINVRIPRSLIGRTDVDVVVTADGRASNIVRVQLK
jgi:uncharacterized protein (TIGR03437 family)